MESKTKKKYACISDYCGGFVGTIEEIMEWQAENGIPALVCAYYEIGKEVLLNELDW